MKKILLITALLSVSFAFCQNDSSLAESYFRQGEYKKASLLFESLQKNNPFNTRYLKRLITCYQEADNYDKAEGILKKVLLKDSTQKYLHIEIGYNFDRQQKPELAKKEYAIAIKSIDSNPNLGGVMGRMFQENNLLDYAIEAYYKSMKFNKNASYEFQIAQIYGEKGAFEKMFDSYLQLIDKNEDYLVRIQQYTSKYINDNATSKNNIAFKKALLRRSISNPKKVWNELLSWLFIKQKEYSKAFIQEKALFNRDSAHIDSFFSISKNSF